MEKTKFDPRQTILRLRFSGSKEMIELIYRIDLLSESIDSLRYDSENRMYISFPDLEKHYAIVSPSVSTVEEVWEDDITAGLESYPISLFDGVGNRQVINTYLVLIRDEKGTSLGIYDEGYVRLDDGFRKLSNLEYFLNKGKHMKDSFEIAYRRKYFDSYSLGKIIKENCLHSSFCP